MQQHGEKVRAAFHYFGCLLICATAMAQAAETNSTPGRLKVGVAQIALGKTIVDNRDRIIAGIAHAAAYGVRVVVFPEGALRGQDSDREPAVAQAIGAIREAAHAARLYVLFGGSTWSSRLKRNSNWMLVVGPDGRDIFRYEKLYDNHRATMPGVFDIGGISCSAIIC